MRQSSASSALRKSHGTSPSAARIICRSIYEVLAHKTHNGFPIVTSEGLLIGLILRVQLITLLKCRAFQPYVYPVTQILV